MRVLHVLNELKPSGAETMLLTAANRWKALGIECEILSIGRQVGVYSGSLSAAGYRIHHLPLQRNVSFLFAVFGFLRRERYSIVHQHAEPMSYWLALAALAAGSKSVRTIHSRFSYSGVLRFKRALQRRHLSRMGVRYVAVAPSVQANEANRFGTSPSLIWNWIGGSYVNATNTNRVEARKTFGFADDDLVLVSVGNCSSIKNHGVILRAMHRLRERYALKYLHVGIEDPSHSEHELARQLGIDGNTFFLGWQGDPRGALAAADVFVMPSTLEGLGLAAIEAITTGMPVILADVDGLRDVADVFGLTRSAEPTVDGFAKLLDEFASCGPTERRNFAASKHRIANSVFSVERGADAYVELYRSFGPRALK